jgi:hypothetical protein
MGCKLQLVVVDACQLEAKRQTLNCWPQPINASLDWTGLYHFRHPNRALGQSIHPGFSAVAAAGRLAQPAHHERHPGGEPVRLAARAAARAPRPLHAC